MTYRITGLDPAQFAHLFGLGDADLARHNAVRVTADKDRGFPCRVSLEDARSGETLILLHHLSHDVATPYRSAYAIFVRENVGTPAVYHDETPPVFEGRPLGLRGFAADGNLKNALLAFRRTDTIFECFLHSTIVLQFYAECKWTPYQHNLKLLKRVKGLYPRLKPVGFTPYFYKGTQ